MSNEVCVVVGAGPGIGLAVARRFGREGFRLALLARKADSLKQYADQLNGMDVQTFSADAGDEESLTNALADVHKALGAPSVLVYNAAMFTQGVPTKLSSESLIASLRVNLVGALVAVQQVVPAMQQNKRGTILFTGGGLATNPSAEATALGIGKASIRYLCFTLAQELTPTGVHAATVTIYGTVQAGTHFDPDTIAEEYWKLHMQPAGSWETEVAYR